MAKAKLDLKSKSDLALLKFGREHRDAMLNNPHFPNPIPSAEEFDGHIDKFAARLDSLAAAETVVQYERAMRDQERKDYEKAFTNRGSYLDIESSGSEAAILSAGVQVYASPTTATSIDAPAGVVAIMTAKEGEIQVSCDAVYRAKFYIAEIREHSETETPGAWGNPMISTRSSKLFKGLVSGKRYAFRMKAQGANELESAWSAEAVCMAP